MSAALAAAVADALCEHADRLVAECRDRAVGRRRYGATRAANATPAADADVEFADRRVPGRNIQAGISAAGSA